jgi:hypothetical protein
MKTRNALRAIVMALCILALPMAAVAGKGSAHQHKHHKAAHKHHKAGKKVHHVKAVDHSSDFATVNK